MSQTYTSKFITTAIAFLLMLLIATPAFASGSEGMMKKKKSSHVNLSCMQTAVATREDAVMTAWVAFNTAIVKGLNDRKTALNTAWASTTSTSTEGARKTQRITAWAKWKKASHDAHMDLKKARKAAWEAFRTTSKNTCRTSTANDEKLGSDATGEVAL